jgi:menaquinone-9 beta-reductase
MRSIDPLILGAGPAGSAAAICLSRGGAKPLILERARETGDALCGGFVSWRTLSSLDRLGIDAEKLGGHPIGTVRIFAGKRAAEAPLPHRAIGISRRRMDTLLIAKAQAEGARLERGVSIREIGEDGVRLADGTVMQADSIFLGVGKHDVRGIVRTRDTQGEEQTLGLRVKLAAHPALTALVADSIELHLFDGGYVGLLLNECGEANLCLAVRKSRLSAAAGDPLTLLHTIARETPALADRLAFIGTDAAIDAIAAVPYGWQSRDTSPGMFKLGDQAAVIPSLAGEGNGIALASGIIAAQAWLKGGASSAQTYQSDFAKRAHRPVSVAKWLWHRGEAPFTASLATIILSRFPALGGALAGITRIPY